jgi:5'-nucleotidase
MLKEKRIGFMNILLTNDDGYFSPGIQALFETFKNKHEVRILAPDTERSGMSHGISMRNPITIRKRSENIYSCSGTPADCVIIADHGALQFTYDVVISGINQGPNLGTDLIYSGTAAGARQASIKGKPGIAVSLATMTPPYEFSHLAHLILEKLDYLISLCSNEVFVNINAPPFPVNGKYDLVETSICNRVYKDSFHFVDAKGFLAGEYSYCFFVDSRIDTDNKPGCDDYAVNQGKASLTRVRTMPEAVLSKVSE